MQLSFSSIKIELMVGIGGGVRSKKNDIRVGDVVISEPNETHGGVVQWDVGKTESGGGFVRKRSLNKPPPVLRHALQTLKTHARMEGMDFRKRICSHRKELPQYG